MNRILMIGVMALAIGSLPSNSVGQENWPQFRGVDGLGVGEGSPPTAWDVETGQNVLWKTRIEGLGHSSPIVWGDRVYLTTATNSETESPSLETGWVGGTGDAAKDSGEWQWKLLSLDRKTGKLVWSKTARTGKPIIQRHLKATHANCSPATNGKVVIAFFGSEGLHCYDTEGNLKWSKDFGRLHSGPYNAEKLEWGFASSPVIFGDYVVVQCDCLNANFISILNIVDGEEIRRIERKDVATWSTPCISKVGDRVQIVCNGFHEMAGYDFESGDQIWTLSGGGDVPVPTPLYHDGLFIVTNGHGRTPIYAISSKATGDLTPEKGKDLPAGLVWHAARGGSYMPTPIIINNLLYVGNDNGILNVLDIKTGEQVYKQRLGKSGTYSASAVASKSHVYYFNESGVATVVRTGREFEIAATNEMDAIVMATPAIFGDQLFVRTSTDLYCLQKQ